MAMLPLFDLCVKITSGFEGTDYGTVAGNFDGQGISAGVLQWNLGAGTLQSYILNHINLLAHDYFPVDMTPLWKLSPKDSVSWTKDLMLDVNGKLKPEWKIAWQKFLTDPSVVNVQKAAIGLYYQQAKCICGKLGFMQENRRAMAYSFDIAVQLWNLSVDRPAPNLEQAKNILQLYDAQNMVLWSEEPLDECQQILVITSHLQALKAKSEWRKVVFARKATIAVGKGIVNKTKWDLKKLF